MKRKLKAYGLKWDPFSREVPAEALFRTKLAESLCWRTEHVLLEDGGFASVIAEPSIAHRTAMSLSGRTIAVLGTPLSKSYPKENSELQNEIAKKFLLISQVPVCRYSVQGPRGNRLFFPERNITMSALTDATIVVEAGETSGTLIQSRAALSQGRKLFILDSCFRNPALTWPEKFERLGAIRVKEYEDIRKYLAP